MARLGGDEFVVLLDAPAPHAQLVAVAEKLMAGIKAPILVMGGLYGQAWGEVLSHDLMPVVYDRGQLEALSRAARHEGTLDACARVLNIPALLVHGWWLQSGAKMSKSTGNALNPLDLVGEFGVDAFRYFLIREMNVGQDSDFTREQFLVRYNSELANKLKMPG